MPIILNSYGHIILILWAKELFIVGNIILGVYIALIEYVQNNAKKVIIKIRPMPYFLM